MSVKPSPSPEAASSEAQRFVEFQYAEMKDLTKHFLTLIAGSLVLTVSLAEKILPASGQPWAKWMLGSSWVLLLLSFVLAGAALAAVFLAAVAAREGSVFGIEIDYMRLAGPSYLAVDAAGIGYAAALVLLVGVGIAGLVGTK